MRILNILVEYDLRNRVIVVTLDSHKDYAAFGISVPRETISPKV